MADQTSTVTNGDFLRAVAGPLAEGEHFHIAGFIGSPAGVDARWGGLRWRGADNCPTDPVDNNYFSVAVLDGPERKRSNFVRMFALVADDPEVVPEDSTWVLQTSAGKRQLGYALIDDEQSRDPALCAAALKAMAERGMFQADKSGNNIVRYVRLPEGTNTKYSPPFAHVLEQWRPERRFTLTQALAAFGIDVATLGAEELFEDAPAPGTFDLRAMGATLYKIDANCDHEKWVGVGMALHHTTEGSAAGFELFNTWSASVGDAMHKGERVYPGRAKVKTKWDSFGKYEGKPITWASVEMRAREESRDDFEDLGQLDVEAPPFEHKATITEDPVAPVSLGFAAVEFTHDGVLPVGVTLIAGGHGSGKTSLLVSLACIETGELDGTDGGVGVELKRHSIYMAEDVGQVHRIRHGLIKHEGMVPNGRFHVVQSRRMSVEQVKAFITKCIERFTIVHESGHLIRPHITFDTTNACFDVQDENSASEVGAVMAAIKETSKGAPVWIVGHLPKAMLHGEVEGLTARGSGAWEADAQTTAFVVHADAKDLDNDVRWLVTKKRRFEAEYTEIRFETYTGTETVPTPWGSLQTLGYRYGVPSRAARGERKAAKEAAKEGKQTEHMVAQAQKATEYLMDLIDLHGEVWMRQGKKGGNTAPEEAKGKVIKWKDIYEFGVIRPNTEGPLRAAVFDSFEPFEGWGKLVPRPEGSLW